MAAKKESAGLAKIKKGLHTSEWWLTLISVLCGLAMASGLWATGSMWERIAGMLASALATMGYTAGRCIVKTLKE